AAHPSPYIGSVPPNVYIDVLLSTSREPSSRASARSRYATSDGKPSRKAWSRPSRRVPAIRGTPAGNDDLDAIRTCWFRLLGPHQQRAQPEVSNGFRRGRLLVSCRTGCR